MFFFFFFQAEDGIRDWSVTGVQTCALPISGPDRPADRGPHGRDLTEQEHSARSDGRAHDAEADSICDERASDVVGPSDAGELLAGAGGVDSGDAECRGLIPVGDV